MLPVYGDFAERYPTPDQVAREKPATFARVVKPLGLHWRIALLRRMARVVSELGEPPDSSDELTKLPGVGPYAAAAYLSFHRNIRAVIVDSNIVRWLGRVFGFRTDAETRRKRWLIELADWLTPRQTFRQYNYAVLDLSMTICRRRPRCSKCPLAEGICEFASGRDNLRAD